jgi:hypothetical protein
MHLKVFVKLKKTLKTLSSGQKPKKTHWAGFFFLKTRVFSNPDHWSSLFEENLYFTWQAGWHFGHLWGGRQVVITAVPT